MYAIKDLCDNRLKHQRSVDLEINKITVKKIISYFFPTEMVKIIAATSRTDTGIGLDKMKDIPRPFSCRLCVVVIIF